MAGGGYQRGWPYHMGQPAPSSNVVQPQPYQGQRPNQNLGGPAPSPVNKGNADVITRPQDVNNIEFKTILENRGGNDESYNITVTTLVLGSIVLPNVAADKFASIIGRVTWGTGGVNTFAEFDWHNGNQFSINGTYLRVDAAINTAEIETPEEIRVGAFYTMGARPARAQLTRTFPKVELAPLTSVAVPVPPYAHAVYIFAGNNNFYSPGTATVRYAGGPNVGATYLTGDEVQYEADGSDFLDAIYNEDGARFPEQTRFIQIINNSQLENIDPTVVFTLNL